MHALAAALALALIGTPALACPDSHRFETFSLFGWNPFAADLDPPLAAEIAAREGWYGSWRLDEQLDRAIAEGELPPMIIAGIAADDGLRSRDLAPVPWDGSAEARGAQYPAFVAKTVVGVVDRAFRTIAEARSAAPRSAASARCRSASATRRRSAWPSRSRHCCTSRRSPDLWPTYGGPAVPASAC